MRNLFGALLLLAFSALVFSQNSQSNLRSSPDDSLGTLAKAETLRQLENLWAHDPRDFPFRAVHAATYSKLKGRNSDAILIQAMPTDGREMQAFYDSQDTKLGQDSQVTEAYNTYYSRLAEALGHNPSRLPRFLKMVHAFHYVDNVDESPWLCVLASTIYKAHKHEYMTAVAQVGADYQKESMECRNPPDIP